MTLQRQKWTALLLAGLLLAAGPVFVLACHKPVPGVTATNGAKPGKPAAPNSSAAAKPTITASNMNKLISPEDTAAFGRGLKYASGSEADQLAPKSYGKLMGYVGILDKGYKTCCEGQPAMAYKNNPKLNYLLGPTASYKNSPEGLAYGHGLGYGQGPASKGLTYASPMGYAGMDEPLTYQKSDGTPNFYATLQMTYASIQDADNDPLGTAFGHGAGQLAVNNNVDPATLPGQKLGQKSTTQLKPPGQVTWSVPSAMAHFDLDIKGKH